MLRSIIKPHSTLLYCCRSHGVGKTKLTVCMSLVAPRDLIGYSNEPGKAHTWNSSVRVSLIACSIIRGYERLFRSGEYCYRLSIGLHVMQLSNMLIPLVFYLQTEHNKSHKKHKSRFFHNPTCSVSPPPAQIPAPPAESQREVSGLAPPGRL